MILQLKTLEKLRLLINEETQYRKGYELVEFFNKLGFNDIYEQGFPSRWQYTDEKLSKINGTPQIDECIKKLFSPVNFIQRVNELDDFINDFNQYIQFDGWNVVRENTVIKFVKVHEAKLENSSLPEEDEFLNREFAEITLDKLGLDNFLTETINQRFDEIKKCLTVKASLSVIFLSGSTLEGILLGIASRFPKEYNQSIKAPKDKEGKVQQFQNWTLNNLIDVAHDLGHLKEDVRKFSHSLRDFRNYIHPFQQASSRFNPDEHTALLCWQVLKTAIFQLIENIN